MWIFVLLLKQLRSFVLPFGHYSNPCLHISDCTWFSTQKHSDLSPVFSPTARLLLFSSLRFNRWCDSVECIQSSWTCESDKIDICSLKCLSKQQEHDLRHSVLHTWIRWPNMSDALSHSAYAYTEPKPHPPPLIYRWFPSSSFLHLHRIECVWALNTNVSKSCRFWMMFDFIFFSCAMNVK